MDDERFKLNTAWIKKGGYQFEVVVDPNAAVLHKQTGKMDIRELVKSGHVYHDAKKGDLASEQLMEEVFKSTDPFVVAERIVLEGEIQLTKEFRDKLREQKYNRLVQLIHRNAVDPKTKIPHPLRRIELAFEEAKIRIDEYSRPEDQLHEVVRKLQPILPISFEERILAIHIPAQYAAKVYGAVQGFGTVRKQDWLSDGSWAGELVLPAGIAIECIDSLNSKTHGTAQITQH